jgi:hypothetical protein
VVREIAGAGPAEVVFFKSSMSQVYGLRLTDGRRVALKARGDSPARATICLQVQAALKESGFPCPTPLSGVDVVGRFTVHLEEWVGGGQRLQGTAPAVTDAFARLLADLVGRAGQIPVDPPVPAPPWAAWDHPGPGLWPDDGVHLPDAGHDRMPGFVLEVARRVRSRLDGLALPSVIGHSDWETQNMAWLDGRPFVVHDWDSLAWQPEAAIAGLAAATFPSDQQPVLAPLEVSSVFLSAYQRARQITFSVEEIEIAWAAGLWLACHNARMEAVYDKPPLVTAALSGQVRQRLALAAA